VRIVQVVVTDAFAGPERYVAQTSVAMARRGHDVVVLGGAPAGMLVALQGYAEWRPAARPGAALAGLIRIGRADIVNAHLTHAETAAVLTAPRHRGTVVATRHLLTGRGHGAVGPALRRIVEPRIDAEVRVARGIPATPGVPLSVVIVGGVEPRSSAYQGSARTVLMMQRLEPEKATEVGLQAWRASGLAAEGWSLVVAGDGSERTRLEVMVAGEESVTFLGHVADVGALWPTVGVVLAPAGGESLGLTVLEAMAAGIPVVAARAAGHLETLGSVPGAALFAAGDVEEAARRLRELAGNEGLRGRLGEAARQVQRRDFSLDRQVEGLLELYEHAHTGVRDTG
jgi:glycosyltransferase involved in cell wall biosynthesis